MAGQPGCKYCWRPICGRVPVLCEGVPRVYAKSWSLVVGQALREPANSHDVHAVAVYYENQVVVHVPYNLAPTVCTFLRRDVNKRFAEVTGDKVNRSAGYGLEIPCTYGLYGPKPYV